MSQVATTCRNCRVVEFQEWATGPHTRIYPCGPCRNRVRPYRLHDGKCQCDHCYGRNFPLAAQVLGVRQQIVDGGKYCDRCRGKGHLPYECPLAAEKFDRHPVDMATKRKKSPVRDHPTLWEIAQRESEIMEWEITHDPYMPKNILRFMVLPITALLFIFGWVMIAAAPLVGVVMVALSTGLAVFALPPLARRKAQHRPPKLKLVKFDAAENSYLRGIQEPEPFRALCACPGCGNVDTHTLMPSTDSVPRWAKVIRKCALCDREWGQE